MTRSHFIQFSIMVLIVLLMYLTYTYINKSRKDSNIVEKTVSNKLVDKKINKNKETSNKNNNKPTRTPPDCTILTAFLHNLGIHFCLVGLRCCNARVGFAQLFLYNPLKEGQTKC